MRWFSNYLILLLCIALVGCDHSPNSQNSEMVQELPDIPPLASGSTSDATDRVDNRATSQMHALELGDQFVFEKTVTHTLTQASVASNKQSEIRINLVFTIWVEEFQNSQTRFGLRFQHVKYTQEIAGTKVVYDSQSPPDPIPAEFDAMHDLAQKKLNIWRNGHGAITRLTGLKAAHSDIQTVSHSNQMQQQLINDLLDPAFQFLAGRKHSESVKPGQSWIWQQDFVGAVPITEKLNCFCKSANAQTSTIEVTGTINPSSNSSYQQDEINHSIRVTNGHTIGNVRLDLTSGMPVQSNWQRYISMQVKLENGAHFEQRKDTRTELKLRPSKRGQSHPAPANALPPF